jgi:hypothetical protein
MNSAHPTDDHGSAHALDLDPVQTLSPGEPTTPPWVPAVGLALLLAGAVWFLAASRDEPQGESASGAASASAVEAPTQAPSQARGTPPPTAVGQAQPTQLSPEALAAARKQLEEAMKHGALKVPPGAQPGTARPTAPQPAGH